MNASEREWVGGVEGVTDSAVFPDAQDGLGCPGICRPKPILSKWPEFVGVMRGDRRGWGFCLCALLCTDRDWDRGRCEKSRGRLTGFWSFGSVVGTGVSVGK